MRLKYLISFLLIILSPCIMIGQFRQTYLATDSGNAINRIQFLSAAEGFVAFNNWIGYTQDSGHSFQQKPITGSNVDYNGFSVNLTFGFTLNGVYALTRDSLLAYGHYGFVPSILLSVDRGNSFRLIFNNTIALTTDNPGFTNIIFPGQGNIGYALEANRVLKSTNHGNSWFPVLNDINTYFKDFSFVSATTGYLISNEKLLATADAGTSWQSLTPPSAYMQSISFSSPANGWITSNADVYGTIDHGASWTLKNNSYYFPAGYNIQFFNDSTGYGIGNLFDILKTTDAGRTWEPLQRDNQYNYKLYSHNTLYFLNPTNVWAGGGHGFLEHSTNAGGTTRPLARFSADLSFINTDGTVRLKNYSKPGYLYTWQVNGVTFANSYDASYVSTRAGLETVTLIVYKGSMSDTFSVSFDTKVNPPPCSAAFQFTADTGTVVCTSGDQSAALKHIWDFGDGLTDSLSVNPVHSYGAAGTFRIKHIIYNTITHCTDYIINVATILRTKNCLFGDFTYKTDSFYTSKAVFTPSYDNTQDMLWYNRSISWDYGDGSPLTGAATHVFPSAGYYNTCLITTNNNTGCTSRSCKPVQVTMNSTCNGNFETQTITSYSGDILPTHFIDFNGAMHTVKTGKRNTWVFDNKDSVVTGNDENLRYSFYKTRRGSNYGSFINDNTYDFCEGYQTAEICIDSLQRKVTHIVYDSLTGCIDSSSKVIEVPRMENDYIKVIPDPKFPWTVTGVAYMRSSPTDSMPMSTVWNIGNFYFGITNTINNFQFNNPGDHIISVTPLKCIIFTKEVYYIHYNVPAVDCPIYPPDFSVAAQDSTNLLHKNFTSDPTAYYANNSIGNTETWYWGDGDSTVSGLPEHVYARYGDYTVTLKYSNPGGCSKQVSHLVQVRPPCKLITDFTLARDTLIGSRIACFSTSKAVTDSVQYNWKFGNGDSSVSAQPVYRYPKTGTYTMSLTVINGQFCIGSKDTSITITKSDSCSLISNFSSTVAINNLKLINTSSPVSSHIKYNWNFDDGTTLQSYSVPIHAYNKSGSYNICLQTTLDSVCSSNYCKTISIASLGDQVLKVTPNPVIGNFVATYISALDEQVTIKIIDDRGQVINSITVHAIVGINSYPLSGEGLKPGWYTLRAAGNAGNKASTRFLKF